MRMVRLGTMMKLGEGWRVTTKFEAVQVRHDKLANKTSTVVEETTFTTDHMAKTGAHPNGTA
jgi:hypothetical protein